MAQTRGDLPVDLPPLGLRLGLNAVAAAVRALGPLRYRISDPIANATFALQPARRRSTVRNYRAAFPQLTRREARRLAARSFREYARTSIDFLYIQHLPRTRVLSEMRVYGYEAHMRGRQLEGKPGILVLIHHGSWDAPGPLATANGVHLTSVMDDGGSTALSNLVIWARAEIGVEVVPASRSPRTLLRRLRAGHWVALVADIPGDTPSVEVEFLGRKTRFSAAPGILAAHTGAPLVAATSVRTPTGGYLVELFPPVPVAPDSDPGEALRQVIPAFEAAVRRWPEQWFPFRHNLFLDLPDD
ncbi:MAG TPA: lysophospholipid acyltransferase family protein [Candidatus Dormibacteraeota bacterium]|nr:lysophospholipid acyltransferase family protein [Candidatus Dormibacteraeota bacterium]